MFRPRLIRSITNLNIRKISNNKILENALKTSTNNLNIGELLLKTVSDFFLWPISFKTVPTNHIMIAFSFGKYDGYRLEGLRWISPISKTFLIYCGDLTKNFDSLHLTDSNGNPIIISSYVTYNIIDPVKNKINVFNSDVLDNWIESNFRQYLTNYSYNELVSNNKTDILDGFIKKINENETTLKYGIEVTKTGILQINYSTEIAETMLVKQKAKATIEARKELVDATLSLIEDISGKLEKNLTNEDKSKLITCLTVSMISNNSPSNVINLN